MHLFKGCHILSCVDPQLYSPNPSQISLRFIESGPLFSVVPLVLQ